MFGVFRRESRDGFAWEPVTVPDGPHKRQTFNLCPIVRPNNPAAMPTYRTDKPVRSRKFSIETPVFGTVHNPTAMIQLNEHAFPL